MNKQQLTKDQRLDVLMHAHLIAHQVWGQLIGYENDRVLVMITPRRLIAVFYDAEHQRPADVDLCDKDATNTLKRANRSLYSYLIGDKVTAERAQIEGGC